MLHQFAELKQLQGQWLARHMCEGPLGASSLAGSLVFDRRWQEHTGWAAAALCTAAAASACCRRRHHSRPTLPCALPAAGARQFQMETLPADALNAVLAKLDHIDLLAASSACRQMRAAATADSALWRALCTRRWHGTLNTALWPLRPSAPPQQPQQQPQQQQPRADYRAVFASDNGWSAPRLATQRYAGSSWSDELVALHPSTAPDGTTTIVVSSCKELRILEAGPSPEDQVQIRRAANVALRSGRELWSSVAALPATVAGAEGLVAAGGCHGRLALFRLPEAHGSAPSADVMEPASSLVFPGNRRVCSVRCARQLMAAVATPC